MTDLRQGDCLKLMEELPDKSVDMVLCDLPYGTTRNSWDRVLPFEPLWRSYRRVCKANAAIVLFSQMPFTARLAMSNPRLLRYEWIWQKSHSTGFFNANRMPLKAHENILVFYEHLPTYNPQKRTGHKPYARAQHSYSPNYGKSIRTQTVNTDGTRYPIDLLAFPTCSNSGERQIHPTQKPVELLEYLIRTYTCEGETVLDNCMGSGSTGVAAVHTGRSFIGMESDPGYFEMARGRIAQAEAEKARRPYINGFLI